MFWTILVRYRNKKKNLKKQFVVLIIIIFETIFVQQWSARAWKGAVLLSRSLNIGPEQMYVLFFIVIRRRLTRIYLMQTLFIIGLLLWIINIATCFYNAKCLCMRFLRFRLCSPNLHDTIYFMGTLFVTFFFSLTNLDSYKLCVCDSWSAS